MEENQNQQEAKETPRVSSGVPMKTVLLIILLALVAGGLTYLAISPKNEVNNPTVAEKEPVNPADTTLSIDPTVKETANTYSSTVTIDTGKNEVIGVQIELYYDPKVITNVNIVPLDFFASSTEILKKLDPVNGRISYALATPLGDNGKRGQGNIAKITYSSVLGQEATIASFSFLPKTEVSGIGTNASLLKAANDGTIQIATPSPTLE